MLGITVLVFSNSLEGQELVCYKMATIPPCLEHHESHGLPSTAANRISWEPRLNDVLLPMKFAHIHPPRVCPKIRGVPHFKTDPENPNMQDG